MKHLVTRLLLLAVLPVVARADDFTVTTNLDNTITITKYTGPGGDVVIPPAINGLSVTIVGESAFEDVTNSVTSVTIPDSVTSIEYYAFQYCPGLTRIMIGTGVTSIGEYAFYGCENLIHVIIGTGVTSIGEYAFYGCASISRLTVPASVTIIGNYAFQDNSSLAELYFQGEAPLLGTDAFFGVAAPVYYLPNTDGWSATYGGLLTALWNPQIQLDGEFGMGPEGFEFMVVASNDFTVVVEACTDLTKGIWNAVQTNTLSGGIFPFTDTQATNYTRRFYRLQMP
jgi:hypothetical protein